MFLQKLQRFLYGRYGGDQLNIALLIAGIVFSLCGRLFLWPLYFLSLALYGFSLFRSFSRNIPARQRENLAFLHFWSPLAEGFRFQKRKFAERKTYRYFKCPRCKQKLRAPRGRGEIEVTCQKCRNVFRTKT